MHFDNRIWPSLYGLFNSITGTWIQTPGDFMLTRSHLNSRFWIGVSLITIAMTFFLWAAPWRALECGPDEGMEFSKILILLRHPEAVKLVWNDQPWFYTQLVTLVFTVTGFQCWIPRLATLVIVVRLLFIFPRLMPKNAGWPHLVFAGLFFWCWPQIPHLSVSAMLELPAFGLAVIAAALTPRERAEWRPGRFVCAGSLLAIAVQLKLTALIILPALGIKLLLLWWQEIRPQPAAGPDVSRFQLSRWWLPPTLGGGAFVFLYALTAWWSPGWDWSQLWLSHVHAGASPQANQYRFEPLSLLQSPGTLAAAFFAIVILWRQHRLAEAAFPLVLFATVFTIHLNHRPWWDYYGVHFAIPLVLLGGWGAAELFYIGMSKGSAVSSFKKPAWVQMSALLLGILTVASWTAFELPRGYEATCSVRRSERVADNDAVNVLKQYHGRVNWAYTKQNILAVQAGYVMPPELTVLPKKRFWTGNITDDRILATVRQYQCEILILRESGELKEKPWIEFVAAEYDKVWSDGDESIYVAKRLHPTQAPTQKELLKSLGI